jgi:hypothetical protein
VEKHMAIKALREVPDCVSSACAALLCSYVEVQGLESICPNSFVCKNTRGLPKGHLCCTCSLDFQAKRRVKLKQHCCIIHLSRARRPVGPRTPLSSPPAQSPTANVCRKYELPVQPLDDRLHCRRKSSANYCY